MHDELPTEEIAEEFDAQKYPLLFGVVTGAHLFGFPSHDSDVDLRGVHVVPLEKVIGLRGYSETVDRFTDRGGWELDLVTHEIEMFIRHLLKKRNGQMLEYLYSPHLVYEAPVFEELRDIASDSVTRHHVHHYRGFADAMWEKFLDKRMLKHLLYIYRILMTGIHMMKTGEVESNAEILAERKGEDHVQELIDIKRDGDEKMIYEDVNIERERRLFERLRDELEESFEATELPEAPPQEVWDRFNDLLIRIRLEDLRE